MKKVLLFLIMLTINNVGFAQSDEFKNVMPLTDTEIVRKVTIQDIEGQNYENVAVTMKSNQPDFVFTDKFKVKVTVTDTSGVKVWNKTFKNAFLYVFSNGLVKIGKPNFSQMIICKLSDDGEWVGKVREKEGLY